VSVVEGSRPYFEPVDVFDYYPDLHAREFGQMDGQFESHVYGKHQLQALARREDFFGDVIRDYLNHNPEGNYEPETHEQELEALNGRKGARAKGSNKYRIQEYWGVADKELVESTGLEVPEAHEDDVVVPVTVWILGNKVIKLAMDPLPDHVGVYHHFVFDDSVPNLCGGSMCQIVRDSQMSVSSAARMMIDNASVTCGPNVEIDLSKMRPGQDLSTIGAFRSYYTDGRRNPSGHRAVQSISFDNHINDLASVMNRFLEFADMETFVGGYGQEPENTPGEAMRTSAGASMVMGNAALPFRDIVRNFDQFTVSVLNALIAWNDLFNEELEVIGDLRPVAKGATSLIAKEVRAFTLDNLSQTLSEEEMDYIDPEKLVRQRLMSRDIPEKDVMATEEQAKQNRERREQMRQMEMQQAQERFDAEMRDLNADALKSTAQAKRHLDNADATSVKALLEVLDRVREGLEGADTTGGEGAPNVQNLSEVIRNGR